MAGLLARIERNIEPKNEESEATPFSAGMFQMMMGQIMAQFQFGLAQLDDIYSRPIVPEPPDLRKREKFDPKVKRQKIKTRLEKERLEAMKNKETLAASIYTDLTNLMPPEIVTG